MSIDTIDSYGAIALVFASDLDFVQRGDDCRSLALRYDDLLNGGTQALDVSLAGTKKPIHQQRPPFHRSAFSRRLGSETRRHGFTMGRRGANAFKTLAKFLMVFVHCHGRNRPRAMRGNLLAVRRVDSGAYGSGASARKRCVEEELIQTVLCLA